MIRQSQHILKFANAGKKEQLDKLLSDYPLDLQGYIDLIWSGKLDLKKFMSTKDLPNLRCQHATYKNIIYKQASEIIRSQRKKKTRTKPEVKNISIELNCNLFSFGKNTIEFDEFINITFPYLILKEKKKVFTKLNFPIKYHKQSLKYKDWNRKNTIHLRKINGNYYIIFFYEKSDLPKKTEGTELGLDIGYKKLIATSDGKYYGTNMVKLYENISRKKQGSNNFKQALKYRDDEINRICNTLPLQNISTLCIENLKDVKKKSKFSKNFNNKLQRWSYLRVINKLDRICAEQGINLVKVSPSYTSQTCSKCGFVDSKSRKGELFECTNCNNIIDADFNASINILHRGVYHPPTTINNYKLTSYVDLTNSEKMIKLSDEGVKDAITGNE